MKRGKSDGSERGGERERGDVNEEHYPDFFFFFCQMMRHWHGVGWCGWEDLSFCIGDKRSKTSKQGVRYRKAVRND